MAQPGRGAGATWRMRAARKERGWGRDCRGTGVCEARTARVQRVGGAVEGRGGEQAGRQDQQATAVWGEASVRRGSGGGVGAGGVAGLVLGVDQL